MRALTLAPRRRSGSNDDEERFVDETTTGLYA